MSESRSQPADLIRAAGAVVWRGDQNDPEIALIHRPRYDDWTFPKGKLKPGEHPIAGALREVEEETGLRVSLGRALPPIHYLKDGRLKRVDYWTAHAMESGEFAVNDEVDQLIWLPLEEARTRLTFEWDSDMLRDLGAEPLATTPLIFVRHGLAGSRQDWKGDDDHRPLDDRGLRQAVDLAVVLAGYGPETLVSSPSERCVQTVRPYALRQGLGIRRERLLSETGYDGRDSLRLALTVLDANEPSVICSHGKVLPELIMATCEQRFDGSCLETHLRKGAFAVLHHVDGMIVALERYDI